MKITNASELRDGMEGKWKPSGWCRSVDAKVLVGKGGINLYFLTNESILSSHLCIGDYGYKYIWKAGTVGGSAIIGEFITNKNYMNLKEKFLTSLSKEPQKSFRKAGVTDNNDLLTAEGQNVFLSWLLHEVHATAFKTAVVDPIIADMDKGAK